MLFLHTVMQESHHMYTLQLCLVAALAAVVYSDCIGPKHLPFAVLRSKEVRERYPVGTSVVYRCLPGYEPIPETRPVITCLETSEWSEISQFCQGVRCPFPDIENGEIANMTDLRLGDQITFACNKGYRLIGENGARCILLEDKVIWSREPPHCERIFCLPPPTIANGKHSGTDRDDYDYGSAVAYNCESGFSLIGDKTIVCTTDESGTEGIWSRSAPRCEVVECRRPEISNGKIVSSYQNSYTYGDTVMFVCYRGNILQGKNVIKCEANNTWHPAPPICVPRECDPPKHISLAVLKSEEQRESYPVGTTLTYHCIPGYEYIPGRNPNIQCLTTSEWSVSLQFCQKVNCIRPEVSNGQILFPRQSSYTYGDTVMFQCNRAYILHGSKTSKCEADRSWHPAPPTCIPYSCDPPTGLDFAELLDAYKDKTSYPVGSIVKYKCQRGYIKQPEMPFFITCLATMKWSSVRVLCKKQSCGDPGTPKNGRLIAPKDFLFGSSVNFTCDEEHRLIGQSSIQCVVSDERVAWSGEIPICQRISCLPPPEIANGNHNGQGNYVYGSAVTYRCDRPFSLIGSQSIRCESDQAQNGRWSAPAPECKVVSCRTPEVPNGIMRTSYQPSYTYQDRVLFACKPGFKLKDSRGDSSCGADSTWQPRLPECVLDGTLLPSSGPNVTSVFGSQAPAVTVPIHTGALPTLQTELNWEKLFIILQEIKDTVNIKTKSLEERLDGLEKKVDKTIYELKSCCQQANEGLEEEGEQ